MPTALSAGSTLPPFSWPTVTGDRLDPGDMSGWRLLIVYRGKHCPLCRNYLGELESMLDDFDAEGISVAALSADPVERARGEAEAEGWTFPVGCDLQPDQMHEMGLYVSDPRTPEETDRPYSEPGLFVVNPDGKLQIIDISNAPFSRPGLGDLLNGLKFVMKNGYPIRGTA
ncbi:MAG: redoxin domain-containing protein [Pseudomonadota bacterium]